MLRLGYQGKFDSMLKTVTNDICEVKTKFTALESELHINKTVTNNFSKCHENEHCSNREYLEISGIPGGISGNALEETYRNLFQKLMPVSSSNVEYCHHLETTNKAPRVTVKLSKTESCL